MFAQGMYYNDSLALPVTASNKALNEHFEQCSSTISKHIPKIYRLGRSHIGGFERVYSEYTPSILLLFGVYSEFPPLFGVYSEYTPPFWSILKKYPPPFRSILGVYSSESSHVGGA